jgi:hypothetical protein
MGAKNQTKRFEGGDLGYDLGKIWCILAGKLGWTKAILMASRQFFMVEQEEESEPWSNDMSFGFFG